jgi:hypothetical protein
MSTDVQMLQLLKSIDKSLKLMAGRSEYLPVFTDVPEGAKRISEGEPVVWHGGGSDPVAFPWDRLVGSTGEVSPRLAEKLLNPEGH